MNLFSYSVFRDLFVDVFLNLFRRKLRALFTMTGIIIGAFLVVLIFSLSNGLSIFLDQQIRAVFDEHLIEVRMKRGADPERAARGLFGGLGEPPKEIKKTNEEEFLGAFRFKLIPTNKVAELREINGVRQVQPQVWVMARSMQLEGDPREFDTMVQPWIFAGPDMLAFGRSITDENASECILSEAYLIALGIENPDEIIGKKVTIRVQQEAMIAMAGGGKMDMQFLNRLRDLFATLNSSPDEEDSFGSFLKTIHTLNMLRDLANADELKALSSKPSKVEAFEATVVGISKKGLMSNMIYLSQGLTEEMGRVFLRNPKLYREEENEFGMRAVVQATDVRDVPRIKKDIQKLGMRARTLEDIIGFIHGLFGALAAILSVFVLIAVVVAFFSIVNTLFMAVSERKREIGVLQAIGATRGYIAALFAAEAGAIGFLGGLFGLIVGMLLCALGNDIAAYKWPQILGVSKLFVMPWTLVPILLISTTLVGSFAGVIPAIRASRLDPSEALRYE
jgi:ABC-type antimicrobial peptide transport system permease subunit